MPGRATGEIGRALRGLTPRGVTFLAVGAACLLVGTWSGLLLVERVGVLLLALPLVALVAVSRVRFTLTARRELDPTRLPAGADGCVRLLLRNPGRLPGPTLLITDSLPYALGGPAHFVLPHLEGGGRREVSYPVHAARRGHYPIGPLSVRITDPFGLCGLARQFTTVHQLTVTPPITPLPGRRLPVGHGLGDGARQQILALAGEDDVGTRDYHSGDDLRRVHWRATAHSGRLMVRSEEQSWQSAALLLLDTRAGAWRGSATAFDVAVEVAASVGALLAAQHGGLRAIDASGRELTDGFGPPATVELLESLAGVAPSPLAGLEAAASVVHRDVGRNTCLAVLGQLDTHDAQVLARAAGATRQAVAVFVTEPGAPAGPGLPWLRAAGWRCLVASSPAELARTWANPGFSEPGPGGPGSPGHRAGERR